MNWVWNIGEMRGENWCNPIQCQFFAADHTKIGLGLNLDLCGEMPAADCLSHGTALMQLEAEVKGQINWHQTTQSVSSEIFSINTAVLLCTLQGFVFLSPFFGLLQKEKLGKIVYYGYECRV
jgi:hypothetical protein